MRRFGRKHRRSLKAHDAEKASPGYIKGAREWYYKQHKKRNKKGDPPDPPPPLTYRLGGSDDDEGADLQSVHWRPVDESEDEGWGRE